MGIYVMFWHAPADGLPTHFLQLPYDEIEVWLRGAMEDFPEDFDPRIMPLLPWVENLQGVNQAAQGATLTALKSAQARQGGLILTVG